MSPVPDQLNDSGYETQGTVPADVNADQDNFQDKDRQKTLAEALKDDLSKAPWQKESTKGPLEDLEKIAKTVRPSCDGFWHNRDQDIRQVRSGSQKAQEESSPASGQQGR